jgi:hypothetical protein
MFLQHVLGLFTHPDKEWESIRDERCSIGKCYCSHVLLLAAIPVICSYIGTTQIGWSIGGGDPVKLTAASALPLAIMFYITILVGIFAMGFMIHWMGKTYDAEKPLPSCIALAAYTATPLFLIGIMTLYPALWLNLILGLPALAYTVYLLYTGVPTIMEVSKEQGFLFSSAVLAVGLVMLVGVLAATIIIWSIGIGPVYTS